MVRNSAIRAGDLVRMRVRTNEWPPSRPGLYCIRLGVIHTSPKRSIETNTHPLRKGERRSISLQDSAMPGENCRVDHDTVSGDIGDAARQPVSNSGDAPAHESSSQAAGEGIADESLRDVGARTRHVGVSRCPAPLAAPEDAPISIVALSPFHPSRAARAAPAISPAIPSIPERATWP